MKKNILVIGGSYFIGRIFVQQLSGMNGYSVHVLNRGRIPLNIPGVFEYKSNRRELGTLKKALPRLTYDAVIDFCATFPNDVASLLENLPGKVKQYIFISSCSVYEHSHDYPKIEDSPKLSAYGPGPVGEYAFHKCLLEAEAKDICSRKNIPLTILRPTYVYGPYNYCLGESYFFDLLLSGKPIPAPLDSLSLFQLVYIKDIVQILLGCIGNSEVFESEFILSSPECISYGKLMDVLSGLTDRELDTEVYSMKEMEEKNILLPFPLDHHELFSGQNIARMLNFSYTPFAAGVQETFHFYKKNVNAIKEHLEKINKNFSFDIPCLKIF